MAARDHAVAERIHCERSVCATEREEKRLTTAEMCLKGLAWKYLQ